jgi:hypothetical protein
MLIQTPGSFVWAGSLAARLGPTGWSTWGMFVVTGCLQGTLLGMGIFFEVKTRKAREETGDAVSDAHFSAIFQANILQTNGRCIVGYIPDQRIVETDDEGGPVVEDGLTENTPLLNGSRKTSTKSTD